MPFAEVLPTGEIATPLGYFFPHDEELPTLEKLCSIQSTTVRNKVLGFLRQNPHLAPAMEDGFDWGLAYFTDRTGNWKDCIMQFASEIDREMIARLRLLNEETGRKGLIKRQARIANEIIA